MSRPLSLDLLGPDLCPTPQRGAPPDPQRARAIHALQQAVRRELTERQRTCLLRYCAGESQRHIALSLGLAPSTVHAHIAAGKERLLRIFRYSGFFGTGV